MRILMAVVVALTLSGCASKVLTDYDSAAAFSNYTSWAYASVDEIQRQNQSFLSLDGARVQSAIEREMSRKGLREVTGDEADLLVSWQVVEEEQLDSTGVSYGLGFGRNSFGWGVATAPPVKVTKEGKLVLEFVDSDTSRVVWRAASRRYLNERQSSKDRQKLIDEVVTDMFKEYPPGK